MHPAQPHDFLQQTFPINKKFKREYLKEPEKQVFSQIVKTIEFFESDYYSRLHGVLKGLTPLEVVYGQLPGSLVFTNQVREAMRKRKGINLKEACKYC